MFIHMYGYIQIHIYIHTYIWEVTVDQDNIGTIPQQERPEGQEL